MEISEPESSAADAAYGAVAEEGHASEDGNEPIVIPVDHPRRRLRE